MHTIRVNRDIAVEVHNQNPVLIKIRSVALEQDARLGAVILWREEIEPLQDALEEAREVAERWANESH